GARKTKTGYFWALARDDRPWNGTAPPGVAFTYAPGRGGLHAERILQGFGGILQVDVCGRPSKCKRNLTSVQACGRVLTCVRPQRATSTRRGPLWNTWIRSNSARRAPGTHRPNDSSDPVSDRLPIILR